MGISTLADLDALILAGSDGPGAGTARALYTQIFPFTAGVYTAAAAGTFQTCWLRDRADSMSNLAAPAAGPTTWDISSPLALNHNLGNASGGRDLVCVRWGFGAGGAVLYDRLLDVGNLSAALSTPQAVGGAITRNVTGEGNRILLEIWTAFGVTARTITANYVNQDGNPAVSQAAIVGGANNSSVRQAFEIPLAVGDTGVRSITDVTLSGSTGAGTFSISVVRPLSICTSPESGPFGGLYGVSFADGAAPFVIPADACLFLVGGSSLLSITSGVAHAYLHVVEA